MAVVLGRDTLARKAAKSENVDNFRTIPFADWLRLFMHVEFDSPFFIPLLLSSEYVVRLLAHSARTVRPGQ